MTDYGCSDGTPTTSPHLLGGLKVTPASIIFDESDLLCNFPDPVMLNGRRNNLPEKKDNLPIKRELLIALGVILIISLIFLVMISYQKMKKTAEEKDKIKKTVNPNEKSTGEDSHGLKLE